MHNGALGNISTMSGRFLLPAFTTLVRVRSNSAVANIHHRQYTYGSTWAMLWIRAITDVSQIIQHAAKSIDGTQTKSRGHSYVQLANKTDIMRYPTGLKCFYIDHEKPTPVQRRTGRSITAEGSNLYILFINLQHALVRVAHLGSRWQRVAM